MAISSISEPCETYTLSQFIALRDSDKITYYRYSILERAIDHQELVYNINNVIYDYLPEMKKEMKTVIVNVDERLKYQYKPKLLSYDIYGSTEAYFFIMALNGMCNLKQFSLDDYKFYALTPPDLSTFATRIYSAETQYITLNRSNLGLYES